MVAFFEFSRTCCLTNVGYNPPTPSPTFKDSHACVPIGLPFCRGFNTTSGLSLNLNGAPGILSNSNAFADQALTPINSSAISQAVQRCVQEDRGGANTHFYFTVPAEGEERKIGNGCIALQRALELVDQPILK